MSLWLTGDGSASTVTFWWAEPNTSSRIAFSNTQNSHKENKTKKNAAGP